MGKVNRNEGIQIWGGQFEADVVAVGKNATAIKISPPLAQALERVRDEVLASEFLPEERKQEHLEAINEINKEAEKKKPNKGVLKKLGEGLVNSLKVVPDVAKSVLELTQIISKF